MEDFYESVQKRLEAYGQTTDARGLPSQWDTPTLAMFAILQKLHNIEFYLSEEYQRARQ